MSCKNIYLLTPDDKLIAQVNGVDTSTVSYKKHTKDYDELTFTVDRFILIDGEQVESSGYNELALYMTLYLEGIGKFQMQEPRVVNDGYKEQKEIVAYSLEKEFEDKDYVNLKVNTADYDSLERLAPGNVHEVTLVTQYTKNTYYEIKEFITFYNPSNKYLSLLHLILEKMPNWSIDDTYLRKDAYGLALCNKKMVIDEENINLYALLTSTVGPYVECIFLFDTINRKVIPIAKEQLDGREFETNVFIGFRNLANNIDISIEEDSVYTRFNVSGESGNNADLTLTEVNYGQSRIHDLSYFMREPYMNETLVNKVKAWDKWLDDNRETYINLSRQWAELTEKLNTILYKVPADEAYWKQWDTMGREQLEQNLEYFKHTLATLQASVDTRSNVEKYDNNGNYRPKYKSGTSGQVDHDWYMNLLKDKANGYGGYYTYYEIITYIIPNIEMAIRNLGKDKKDKEIPTWKENWDLYGIVELENKKIAINEAIAALLRDDGVDGEEKVDYDDLSDAEKEIYNEYQQQLKDIDKKLAELRPQKEQVEKQLEALDVSRSIMTAQAQMYYEKDMFTDVSTKINNANTQLNAINSSPAVTNRYGDSYTKTGLQNSVNELSNINNKNTFVNSLGKTLVLNFGFTEKEVKTIETLFHDTDYQNSNIVTTSIDTTLSVIEVERDLLADGTDKLSEVSQPQYNFEAQVDNLLRLEEFSEWEGDFDILRFFRLGIRDDYSVKLRIIGMEWNPCEITPDLTLEFSNMVTSRSGRTDLTDILNSENNRGSKNSITLGATTKIDESFAANLMNQLSKMGMFGNLVNDAVNIGSANIDEATIKSLVSGYIKAEKIDVEQITGDEASFNNFFSKYANIDYLVANSASFKQAVADMLAAGEGFMLNLTATNVTFSDAVINNAIIPKITAANIFAGEIVLSDDLVIKSENGLLAMNGQALQIKGKTTDEDGNEVEYVGVQLGYDTNSDPSLILRNKDGATIITPDGITSNAIADKLIINQMIDDKTISTDKLSFNIETDKDGNVLIENLYTGAGQKFGVEYSEFKTNIGNSIDDINDKIDNLDFDIEVYYLEIIPYDGIDIIDKNGTEYNTVTLIGKFSDGSTEINSDITWKWEQLISGTYTTVGTNNTLVVTGDMVNGSASFKCTVTYNEKEYIDFYSVRDKSDPLQVTIMSTLGDVIRNGKGEGALYPIVYQNGIRLDELADIVTSIDEYEGTECYYVNTSLKKVQYMTKTDGIWIVSEEPDYICDYQWTFSDKNGNTITNLNANQPTNVPVIYMDGSLIQQKIIINLKVIKD